MGIGSKVQKLSGECKKSSASGLNTHACHACAVLFAADIVASMHESSKRITAIYIQYKNIIFLIYTNDILLRIYSYIHPLNG